MKKALFSALAIALIYGCASTPPAENAPSASPGTPGQTPPAPPPSASARPLQPAAQGDPLKDPNSGLGKRSVFYDLDRYDVKDEYRTLLQAHGKYLAEHRSSKMLVQGNCDERGSREYNIALGQKRAEGVKRMLVLMGATDSQVEPVSLGEEKPRCSEHAEGCWSQNRRSDMLYSGEY
ncbi:MAG TPA: peptidoglycan-associated lipoprotein Pal [Burkholderiales bacterium]|jgi:peptidoglycan-associated lipoprotein|nr:peptidoglycan-associated lipoprotein Pal [Burkholderiales bacterium]